MATHDGDLTSGLLIGEWRIETRLATGPRGETWQVTRQPNGETAVLRLLPAGRSANDLFRRRFFQECDRVAQLAAPEIAKILGWGDHAGRIWCVNEFFADGSLADRFARNWHATGAEVIQLGVQAARGLTAAHFAGIEHRGLQPSDLLLAGNRAAIGGFGLASDRASREALSDMLEAQASPECAAPERLRNSPTDPRSDLYALGCVLYWAMARHPPFIGTPDEIIKQHLETQATPLRMTSHGCPPGLDEIVNCLLRKDPQYRYPNAMTLLEDLDRVGRGDTPTQAQQIKTAETSRTMAPVAATDGARPGRTSTGSTPARHSWLVITLLAIVIGLALGLAAAIFLRQPDVDEVIVSPAPPVSQPLAQPSVQVPATTDAPVLEVTPPPEPHLLRAPSPPSADDLAKAAAEKAQRVAQQQKVAALVNSGGYLGPVEELTQQLGTPDLSEDQGAKLWYGDYVFTVADGLVLSVKQLNVAPTR